VKSFYLTTPIYYVNDAPHIGHAYTTVAGDVLTRWHRQRGESVWFLTGTDEHGQKVMRTAEQNNVAPQAWVDKLVADAWKPNWSALNIANDDFIRTTEPRHTERVQKFLQSLKDAGHIYAGKYEGPYCVGCEEFKLPGDLIDADGEKLCPIHSKPIELVNENNWFFRLSAFVEPLLEHYRTDPDACQPESARNEVVSFLEGGVSDLSISRSTFDWGIPVPWDTDQVVYVWFDALLNYATAVGLTDASDTEGGKKFAQTWPADVHLVGKDILRFHAVIWPAMLMAAGLAVPKKVFAHGWLLVGRLAAMIEKYCDGKVPAVAKDAGLSSALAATVAKADAAMVALDFQGGITAVMDFCKKVNGYVTEKEPWILAKDEANMAELNEVLYNTAESLRALAVLLHPVMPATTEILWESLGANKSIGSLGAQVISNVANWGQLPEGTIVTKTPVLFPRLEITE